MTVLGIDPGTAACGFGIVQEKGNRLKAVEFGWWQTSAKQRPELRLKTIFDGVIDLIEQFNPHAVAVEESFVGVDARTALSVGRPAAPCSSRPRRSASSALSTRPRSVKQAVCGYGRAEKAQVQRMVMAILGLKKAPTAAPRSGCARRGDLPRAGPAPPPRE